MRCQWCGSRNPVGARYCVACERDLLAEQTAAEAVRQVETLSLEEPEVSCPRCEALNSATTRYCTLCGTTLLQPKPEAKAWVRPMRGHILDELITSVEKMPRWWQVFVSLIALAIICLPFYCVLAYTVIPTTSPFSAKPEPELYPLPAVPAPVAVPVEQPATQAGPASVTIPIPMAARQVSKKQTYDGAGATAVFRVEQPAYLVRQYYRDSMYSRLKTSGWRPAAGLLGDFSAEMRDYDGCELVIEVDEDIYKPDSVSQLTIDVRLGWRAAIWFTPSTP